MTIQYVVKGDLDAAGMKARQSDWNSLAVANDNVRLDLSEVRKIDSTGLGAILFLFKRLKAARKRFEIINAKEQPAEFLARMNISAILSAPQAQPKRRIGAALASRVAFARSSQINRAANIS